MKLIQTTLALVTVLGLAACETETEEVMVDPHGEDAMMDDTMKVPDDTMMEAS